MTNRAHAVLLVAVPVAFSGLLWQHPVLRDPEDLLAATTRFQIVHLGMVVTFCLLAVGMHVLLAGLRGGAAAVGRIALIPFVAFYVPYLAFEGVAAGVLGQELNELPAAQRDAIAPGLIEDFSRNPIVGEPGIFWALGSAAWLVAVVAAVLAFRRAGAPLALQVLLGTSALVAAHTPPLGAIGLLAFAGAGWMVLRRRDAAATEAAPAVATVA
jgi:hypothetical protein